MILFTTEEEILENVAANDSTFLIEYSNEEEAMLALSSDFNQRPSTADKTEVIFLFKCLNYSSFK